jgi:hypothetical protein
VDERIKVSDFARLIQEEIKYSGATKDLTLFKVQYIQKDEEYDIPLNLNEYMVNIPC